MNPRGVMVAGPGRSPPRAVRTTTRLGAGPGALLGSTLAAEGVAIALSWGLEPVWDTVLYAVSAVAMGAVGALIVSRHPGHRIGWLFIAQALVNGLGADVAQGWALRAAAEGWTGGPVAEWIAVTSWVPSGTIWVLTFLLFPDGHLPRRRWIMLVWANVAGLALVVPGWGLNANLSGMMFIGGVHPFVIDGSAADVLAALGFPLFMGSFALSVLALVQRFRRASGDERQQLRLFVLVWVCAALVLPMSSVRWTGVPVMRVLPALAVTAMPLAAAAAILRYRLFDIDVVIRRTLVYAVLSGLLVAVYAGSVVVLREVAGGVTGDGSLPVAVSTLLVAALFAPARRRVQRVIDRRFFRSRYDAAEVVARFADELRRSLALDDVRARAERVVVDVFAPETVTLTLLEGPDGGVTTP